MYPDDEKHTSFKTPVEYTATQWCPSAWRMLMRQINTPWLRSFTSIYVRPWNATSMTSLWKATTRAITSRTWGGCLTSCRLISCRWTQPSPSWGYPVINYLDLLLHPKELMWILRRSVPSKRCNLREISKNSEVYGIIGLHSKIHIKSIRTLPTLHQVDEEGSLICLGQCLPRSIWRD